MYGSLTVKIILNKGGIKMKKKKEVARIWDREKRCLVEVKPLKFLTFRAAPGFKFFLSKAYKELGFVVTETTTGARVTFPQKSMTAAVREARTKIQQLGTEKFCVAVKKALEVH
jgi:hypothetical protein